MPDFVLDDYDNPTTKTMIKVTGNKVVVDPIFDRKITDTGNKLTPAEIKYLESLGEPVPSGLLTGLIIPDEALERCDQGIVKYVGSDCHDVQVGDYVLFSGYSGTTVRLEGEGVVIILAEDFITCIIESPDTDVSGLFFRSTNGEYWPATYEMSVDLIRRAIEELRLPIRTPRKRAGGHTTGR